MFRRALLRKAFFRRIIAAQTAPPISVATALNVQHPLADLSATTLHRHAIAGVSRRSFHASALRSVGKPFKLADIGEGITEVEITKWHVQDGTEVQEFDVLCEVQSDKSSVELTAHATGIVRGIAFAEGETVKVGQILCSIQDGQDEAGVLSEEAGIEPAGMSDDRPLTATSSPSEPEKHHNAEASGSVEEDATSLSQHSNEPSRKSHVDTFADTATTLDHSLFSPLDTAMDSAGAGRFSGEGGVLSSAPTPSHHYHAPPEVIERRKATGEASSSRHITKASPAVRTLAARLGVNLGGVRGTGEGGRVTRLDVESAAGSGSSTDSPNQSIPSQSNLGDARQASLRRSQPRELAPTSTRVEFGRTRKVMYRAMGDQGSVPHFGYSHTVNLTPLLPYIQSLNTAIPPSKPGYVASDIPLELVRDPIEDSPRQKTTLLTFLVKGLLLALEEHPIMRARVKEEEGAKHLQIGRDANIGIAVSDPKFGLLTPSLPPLSPSSSLSSITSALSTLRQSASRPSPAPNVTVSSVGALGESRMAMPVLPPGGGVAICAVGRARWEVEWKLGRKKPMELISTEVSRGGTEAVLRIPVGWSGDHRVLEGAELIAFTETWKRYIEEPWRWINPT